MAGLQTIGGKTYYLNEKRDGSYGAVKTGWVWQTDTYYYFNKTTGVMVVSDWIYDGGKQYYQGPDGKQVSGWQEFGGERFFLNDKRDGTFGAVVSGWRYIGQSWYYFNPVHNGHFGAMRTGWLQDGSKRYYLDENGVMATGWREIDGVRYYFSEKTDGSGGVLQA